MKKNFLPIFVLTWVLVLSGLCIFQTDNSSNPTLEYIFVGVLIVLFLLGIYLGYMRFRALQKGMTVEDELSIKLTQKAASVSYYISLFLWSALIYVHYHSSMSVKWLLSSGMIGMAVIFVITWVVYNRRGLKDEN